MPPPPVTLSIAVIGAHDATPGQEQTAETTGQLLAAAGAVVVTGGLGGVMAAACRGAQRAGGVTLGILPGADPADANEWVDIAIPTGLGEARNTLVVRAAAAVIAIGGGYGTLSEIGFARRIGTPVIGIGTWQVVTHDAPEREHLVAVETPHAAVDEALALGRR